MHAQDSKADFLRALGRVTETTKSKQGQSQQAQQGQPSGGRQDDANTLGLPTASPVAVDQQPTQAPDPAASQVNGPPQDEAKAIYEKAKLEGRSDEEAWLLGELSGYVKQLHEAAAGPNQLAFKNLKVGAEFPMNIGGTGNPSVTGRNVVSLEDGDAPEMNRPKPKHGAAESWRCWTQAWAVGIQCQLLESPDLTTAFGETLESVDVFLTKPQYDYQPQHYAWQKDMHPRIAAVHIVADGKQFAKAANEYAKSVFRAAPKVATSKHENGLTPNRAACAAVNSKRVADLTTNDLALRRACANPTTGLFRAMETPETHYKYENADSGLDIVELQLINGQTQVLMALGSAGWYKLAQKQSERVQALRAEYAARRAKEGRKDF